MDENQSKIKEKDTLENGSFADKEESLSLDKQGEEKSEIDTKTIICPKCGEEMPETLTTCVNCGYNLKKNFYQPMNRKKQRIIRWVAGGLLLLGFAIYWFVFR